MKDVVERALEALREKPPVYDQPPNVTAFVLAQKLRGFLPADALWDKIEPYSTQFFEMAQADGLMVDYSGVDIELYEFECMVGLAMGQVKFPDGQLIKHVTEQARLNGTPKEAESLPSNTTKLLCAVCKELQRIAGGESFFLSQATAGKILGGGKDLGYRQLIFLQAKNFISLTKKGHSGIASEFRYNF